MKKLNQEFHANAFDRTVFSILDRKLPVEERNAILCELFGFTPDEDDPDVLCMEDGGDELFDSVGSDLDTLRLIFQYHRERCVKIGIWYNQEQIKKALGL